MKRIKIFTYIILFLLLISSFSNITVQASVVDNVADWTRDKWIPFVTYTLNKMGVAIDNGANGLYDWVMENEIEPIRALFEDFKSGVSVKNGKVLVSSDAMNALKDITDAYIEDYGSYFLIDTYSSGSEMFTAENGADNSWYTHAGDINAFKHALNIPVGDKIFNQFFSGGIAGNHNIQVTVTYRDCTDLFFVGYPTNGKITIYDSSGNLGMASLYKRFYSDSSGMSDFEYDGEYSVDDLGGKDTVIKNNKLCVLTNDGRKVMLFKTVASLKNYLQGVFTENKIYTTSIYNNYDVNNDNSISIDASTAQYIFEQGDNFQVDMSKVINSVTFDINNYYTNNGVTMSQQDIQNAIDTALQKFLEFLPKDPEEPTEPETSTETETPTEPETETGGDISGNDVSGNGVDGPKTVGLLTKIYNKLSQTYNLLKGGILDALNGIKTAVSGGVSGNDVSGNGVSGNDAPSDGKSWFEKIYDKLSEIKRAIIGDTVVGGLGDLLSTAVDKLVDLADTVKDSVVSVVPEVTDAVSDILDGTEETIGKMVDNVGTNFRPVGDKMKTKFPFSIPWDIAAVVGSLSAAPETPVFEIPIVFERYDIDYTLTIDMADFEVISKISRLFLSLTFVLFLTKLTIQVVKMEKEL